MVCALPPDEQPLDPNPANPSLTDPHTLSVISSLTRAHVPTARFGPLPDIVLQFCLMFEESSESMTQGASWVVRPLPIAWHYLTGWFTLDFVSVAISAIDLIALFEEGGVRDIG